MHPAATCIKTSDRRREPTTTYVHKMQKFNPQLDSTRDKLGFDRRTFTRVSIANR